MNELKAIWESKLNIGHFILSLIITCLLAYGIFLLSWIFGWLCCMQPAASSKMFSDLPIFWIFTFDLTLLLWIVSAFYFHAKKKKKLRLCKSYLIVSIILILTYLIITPWCMFVD